MHLYKPKFRNVFQFFLIRWCTNICFCLPQTCIFHIKVFNFLYAFILLYSLSKMDKTFPVLKSHFFRFLPCHGNFNLFLFFHLLPFLSPWSDPGFARTQDAVPSSSSRWVWAGEDYMLYPMGRKQTCSVAVSRKCFERWT